MQLTFKIPQGATLIPEESTSIKIGDPLITFHSSEQKVFAVASALSVKPESIFNYLSIVVGQEVSPGTLLAEKKALVGKKQLQSDIEGVVDRIVLETGEIVVLFGSKATGQSKEAWFNGTIKEIDKDKNTFKVSFKDGHEFTLKSATMDGGGKLFKMDDKDFFTVGADEVAKKIVILENPQVHIISKLDALDAAGSISAMEFPPSDFPTATISTKKALEELFHLKKDYCAFSALELKAVAY